MAATKTGYKIRINLYPQTQFLPSEDAFSVFWSADGMMLKDIGIHAQAGNTRDKKGVGMAPGNRHAGTLTGWMAVLSAAPLSRISPSMYRKMLIKYEIGRIYELRRSGTTYSTDIMRK